MLSLIITNYNTWELTERCVKSVNESGSANCIDEIIIVDDCSTQQAPEFLLKFSKVKLIYNAQNYGYAKCVNIGFENAENEICLLLDSDAYLIDQIDGIINSFKNEPLLGVLGFKLIDEKENGTGNFEPEVNTWGLILGQKIESKLKPLFLNKNNKISVYSCAIAIRKTAFNEVNGFDETFDFLDADHDFSMKINKSKWGIAINDNLSIFHKGGGSPQLTSKRVIRFYTNRILLLKKHQLLKFEKLTYCLVIIRLVIEYILFKLKLLFKPDENLLLNDKILGRKTIIKIISNKL